MGMLLWLAAVHRSRPGTEAGPAGAAGSGCPDRERDTTGGIVKACKPAASLRDTAGRGVYVEGVEIAPPPMTTFFTAEQLLTIAEDRATAGNPAVIGGIYSRDLADFRHAVRTAAVGAVLHIPGAMAQTDSFPCVGQLQDGTRLFQDYSHPGIDADEWALIAD